MLSKLGKNEYVFSILTKGVLVIIGLANSVMINRYLGPSLKGEYSYLLNIANIVVLILNLGIYQSYPYYKRQSLKNIKQRYFNIFSLQFIIYIIIAAFISILTTDIRYTLVTFLIPFMVFVNQLNFITMVENVNLKNMINLTNQVIYSIILIFVFLFFPEDYLYLFILLLIKDILIIVRIIKNYDLTIKPKFKDLVLIKQTVKYGFFPMLTMLLITMNYQFDVIMLKMFLDFEQIGYYTVGVGLANQIWIIPDAFKDVLFSKTASKDSIEDIVLSIKINLYISFILLFMIIIFGKQIITLLYGAVFVDSYTVTVVLFFGIIPMIFYKLIYTLFVAIGKQRLSFNILLISVVLNIIGNLIAIPKLGIVGAALASVLSYSICGGTFLYVFKRHYFLKIRDLILINEDEIKRFKTFRNKC